jgi:hypothetical protein
MNYYQTQSNLLSCLGTLVFLLSKTITLIGFLALKDYYINWFSCSQTITLIGFLVLKDYYINWFSCSQRLLH